MNVLPSRASTSEGKAPTSKETHKPDFVRQIIDFARQTGHFLDKKGENELFRGR